MDYRLPTPPPHPVPLLDLTHELLHCIAAYCDGLALIRLSVTCRSLHSFIRHNRLLHKEVYLATYDDPRQELEWEKELLSASRLERLLLSDKDKDVKRDQLDFVAEQVFSLVRRADVKDQNTSRNLRFLNQAFEQADNIDAFLCASSMFGRPGAGNGHQRPAATLEMQRSSAKLHSLFGVPIDAMPSRSYFAPHRMDITSPPSSSTRSHDKPILTHPFARSKVYDLREYTEESLWGPFMSDGSGKVDWEKVEAVMIVLGYNLRKFSIRSDGRLPFPWDRPFMGATPRSYHGVPRIEGVAGTIDEHVSKLREVCADLTAQDPYGVTGTWMRVVCFLDYNDLHEFNFLDSLPAGQLRDPIETEEAIRLISIKLHVTRVIYPGPHAQDEDDSDEEEEDDGMDWSGHTGPRMPIVHFEGTSRSLHASWDPNANSRIRGSVRTTPEGEVRWTTFSIFHGQERWRSEGIQVGGLKSARGILGNWFDKDYNEDGPAGPTAFWKLSDELGEEKGGALPLGFY